MRPSTSIDFNTAPIADLRVLRKSAVLDLIGLSSSSLYKLEAAGQFPTRVLVGENSIGWLEKEVRDWVASRYGAQRAKPRGDMAAPARAVRATKHADKKAGGGRA